MVRFAATLSLLLALSFAAAQSFAERFDTAWRLVSERYWDLSRLEVDWDGVRERYLPTALAAADEETFYAVLEEMYKELGDDHSVFVPPARVEQIRSSYGDLPCLGLFSQRTASTQLGNVAYELLDSQLGYVRVPDLATPGVAGWVRSAVQELDRQQPRGFILDLRDNPGGSLREMMLVAGVFTRGFLWRLIANWTLPIPYPAIGAVATELPLVVLIDGGVNSAAEGLAGALQQRGRATVIGERSAGNVEAVLPFCLRDGSQAWIASGVLAPIGGPTWEGVGVIPDIETEADDALKAAVNFLLDRP